MTVAELIEKLKTLPPEMGVAVDDCEWGLWTPQVDVVKEWNGVEHVELRIGDSEYEVEPTPAQRAAEPKPVMWRCQYCGKEKLQVYSESCGCQNWRPMMIRAHKDPEPKEELNAPAEEGHGPGRDQD